MILHRWTPILMTQVVLRAPGVNREQITKSLGGASVLLSHTGNKTSCLAPSCFIPTWILNADVLWGVRGLILKQETKFTWAKSTGEVAHTHSKLQKLLHVYFPSSTICTEEKIKYRTVKQDLLIIFYSWFRKNHIIHLEEKRNNLGREKRLTKIISILHLYEKVVHTDFIARKLVWIIQN